MWLIWIFFENEIEVNCKNKYNRRSPRNVSYGNLYTISNREHSIRVCSLEIHFFPFRHVPYMQFTPELHPNSLFL